MSPVYLRRFAAALAAARAGTGMCRIDAIGDSTTASSANSTRQTSWAWYMHQRLSQYVPGLTVRADAHAGCSDRANVAAMATYDPRFNFGAGWLFSSQTSYAGKLLRCPNTSTEAMTFAPGAQYDRVQIEYITRTTYGVAEVLAGATVLGTIDQRPADSLASVTLNVASPTTDAVSIRRTGTGGDIYVLGIRTWLSTDPGVSVAVAGWVASDSGQWAANTGANAYYSPIARIGARQAHLLAVALGVNDWTAAVDVAVYRANIDAIVAAQQSAGGDCLLIWQPASAESVMSNAGQERYADALRSISADRGCALAEIPKRWGYYTEANAGGLMNDTRHPSNLGGRDWGDWVAKLLAGV